MMTPTQARVAAALVFVFIFMGFSSRAFGQQANGPVIFDVRRSLPLEADEDVVKDFYINAGPEAGFKKGVYISVVRAVPVHDPIKNVQQATLNIPVGQLKVIDVQRGITVARLESELGDDERPTLEFEGIMVGDHIDLGTITTEQPKKPKPKAKRHVSQSPSEEQNPGSAAAMAARAAAPAPESANGTIELSPSGDVAPEASPAPPATATEKPEPQKKSQAPKSADLDLEAPAKKPYPRSRAADTVRVADYS